MKPYSNRPLLFFIQQMKPYRLWFAVALMLTVAELVSIKIGAFLFSKMVDVVAGIKDVRDFEWSKIAYYLLAYGAATVFSVICYRYKFKAQMKISAPLPLRLWQKMMSYVIKHSARFLIEYQAGKLSDKVNRIAQGAQGLFWNLQMIILAVLDILLSWTLLVFVHWSVGCLAAVWLILLTALLIWSARVVEARSAEHGERSSTVTGHITDTLSNVLLVKGFGHFVFELFRLKNPLRQLKKTDLQFAAAANNRQCALAVLTFLFDLSMIVSSFFLWRKGIISVGEIVLVLLMSNTCTSTFRWFIWPLLDLHRVLGDLKSGLQIVSVPWEIKDKTGARPIRVAGGEIEFKDVDFSYSAGRPLFKKLNIRIKGGERVGLVGVSGSGKSSLVNLLQRFFEIQGGSILVDGQDIRDITQLSLHRQIAVVPQDTSLFHRSLKDNIAYGRPHADMKHIVTAAKKSYCHEFIKNLPLAYDALVGDKGVKLSGGQRQRVAIARAFLKNAPILILDEATSSLDSESEYFIQQSMKRLMKGRTTIVIAHRLSTLKEMDRILVMKNGRVVEQGMPRQLLNKKGTYAKLWQMQIQPASAEPEDKTGIIG